MHTPCLDEDISLTAFGYYPCQKCNIVRGNWRNCFRISVQLFKITCRANFFSLELKWTLNEHWKLFSCDGCLFALPIFVANKPGEQMELAKKLFGHSLHVNGQIYNFTHSLKLVGTQVKNTWFLLSFWLLILNLQPEI